VANVLVQSWEHLVRFFAAVAVANDAELGWDPTIQRVIDEKEDTQYRFMVGRRRTWYQSVGCLSNTRTNAIVGRATRVWKVIKLVSTDSVDQEDKPKSNDPCSPDELVPEPSGTVYALKDVWMDSAEEQEAMLLKRIRWSLKHWLINHPQVQDAALTETVSQMVDDDFIQPDDAPDLFASDGEPFMDGETRSAPYMKYFPQILDHGYVYLNDPGDEDVIRDDHEHYMEAGAFKRLDIRKVYNPQTAPLLQEPVSVPRSATEYAMMSHPLLTASATPMAGLARKRGTAHYRAVYRHVGTPLHNVVDLRAVLEGIHDAAVG
jgi:hypothetical protein